MNFNNQQNKQHIETISKVQMVTASFIEPNVPLSLVCVGKMCLVIESIKPFAVKVSSKDDHFEILGG